MEIIELIKSGKNFNRQVDGNFYYCVDGFYYRLRRGQMIPEQWNGKWVKC